MTQGLILWDSFSQEGYLDYPKLTLGKKLFNLERIRYGYLYHIAAVY